MPQVKKLRSTSQRVRKTIHLRLLVSGATREVVWRQAELPGEAQPSPSTSLHSRCVIAGMRMVPYLLPSKCLKRGRAGIMKAHSVRRMAAVIMFIEIIARLKARFSLLSVPRNPERTRLFCSNSLPNTYNAYNNWAGF